MQVYPRASAPARVPTCSCTHAYASVPAGLPASAPLPPLQVYLLLHLCFCLCTLLLSWPCWHLHAVHTGLLAAVATAAIWAGASYYFEIFATRQVQGMHAHTCANLARVSHHQPVRRPPRGAIVSSSGHP